MTKIALILPYFGKLPNFFRIWLDSCRANLTVDWLLFTDDESKFDFPPNVRVTRMPFDALRERVAALLGVPTFPHRPSQSFFPA